jgi:hypothetical protein
MARRMSAARRALLAVTALLLGATPASAQAALGEYDHCGAVGEAPVVDVSGAPCTEAQALAAAMLTRLPAEGPDVLRTAGWTPLRALVAPDATQHDIVATRGRAVLHIRRPGATPDIDGWAAGRELVFARPTLVPGADVPSGGVLCTSAFLLRLPAARLGGLSASHCGGIRSDGTTQRRNAALRRLPQPGVLLGRVVRNLERTRPLDALVLPIPTGPTRSASAIIDRGITRPPWWIAGTAQPFAGRAVCFSGRTSGIDQCGRIADSGARPLELRVRRIAGTVVRCTTIRAREGDSGSAVYTAPRADGSVRAVGIAVIVVGIASQMCFTPLQPVLDALSASVVTAPAA